MRSRSTIMTDRDTVLDREFGTYRNWPLTSEEAIVHLPM